MPSNMPYMYIYTLCNEPMFTQLKVIMKKTSNSFILYIIMLVLEVQESSMNLYIRLKVRRPSITDLPDILIIFFTW